MAIFIERHKTVQALVFRTISKNYSKEVILEVTKNFLAYGFCFVCYYEQHMLITSIYYNSQKFLKNF